MKFPLKELFRLSLQEGDNYMMKHTNSLHRFQQIIYAFIEDGNTALLMH